MNPQSCFIGIVVPFQSQFQVQVKNLQSCFCVESEINDGSFTEEATRPQSCYVSTGSNNPLSSLQFAAYFFKLFHSNI